VCPTNLFFIKEIEIKYKNPNQNDQIDFFYRPTLPFNYDIEKDIRKAVLCGRNKDKYCSLWSEWDKYSKSGKLKIKMETLGEMWKILLAKDMTNKLVKYDKNTQLNCFPIQYVPYSTIVFREPIKNYKTINVIYKGINVWDTKLEKYEYEKKI